jgi:predicted small integral membrane protein
MNALANLMMLLLFVGGILAISNLIAVKSPEAKKIIDRLVPYQALIGVAMLASSLVLIIYLGPINMFRALKVNALVAITFIGGYYAGILLGFFFGMPLIAKWIPGESSAEVKALELSRKLAPYTMLVGIVALGAGGLMLLYKFGLLKYI